MKAVLQYRASPGFCARLECFAPGEVDVVVVPENERDRFAREMVDADVLLHVLEPVTARVIEAAPRLRLIQKIGVGVNTIDLEAARRRGVRVANMPGTNTAAVAEMTLLLMLAALRRPTYFDGLTRSGEGWQPDPAVFDGVGELAGRRVGLVGYGAVARRLAPVLAALGARVSYTATAPKQDALAEWRDLDALLAEADVISLHLPLLPETGRLLDRRRLSALRPGAVLVNTARGGLVDEAALLDALRSGPLAAAGLDVFEKEPVDPANPLLQLQNVVLAPHVAWLTPETLERSLGVALENCRRVAAGREPVHAVV